MAARCGGSFSAVQQALVCRSLVLDEDAAVVVANGVERELTLDLHEGSVTPGAGSRSNPWPGGTSTPGSAVYSCAASWRGRTAGGACTGAARVMRLGTSWAIADAAPYRASQRERQARRASSPDCATITCCSQASRQSSRALGAAAATSAALAARAAGLGVTTPALRRHSAVATANRDQRRSRAPVLIVPHDASDPGPDAPVARQSLDDCRRRGGHRGRRANQRGHERSRIVRAARNPV